MTLTKGINNKNVNNLSLCVDKRFLLIILLVLNIDKEQDILNIDKHNSKDGLDNSKDIFNNSLTRSMTFKSIDHQYKYWE